MSSVYRINKGINKPIEFRGLKAQWIAYLGGGLVLLLVLFAILYIIGTNVFICLLTISALGTALFLIVFKGSAKYGQYGLMKKTAAGNLPDCLKFRSRKLFIHLANRPSSTRKGKEVVWSK